MTGYVFLYVCIAFSCGTQTREGDGQYYESKVRCHQMATRYAQRHMLRLNRWEVICVERERAVKIDPTK